MLEGPLGAGKSALVAQCVTLINGAKTSSPSFSLINDYSTAESKIFHIDLYRLESEDELENIGFWDLFLEKQALIFVEWPDRVSESLWPHDWARLRICIDKTDSDIERLYQVTHQNQ